MAFPNFYYKRRCFFVPHSKCAVKGDYRKCPMMQYTGEGLGLFHVPDDRPIYDEQECEHFSWR